MDDIADRAARVSARHPSPVLSFEELGRLVRGSGVSVTDDILLHSLTREAGRFRVINPWRGPWHALVRSGTATAAPRRSRRRIRTERGSRAGDRSQCPRGPAGISKALGEPDHLPDGPWVVAEAGPSPWSPGGSRLAVQRLREALLHLGWALDERSARDTARWCSLVGEAGRVRRKLSALDAAREPQPSRSNRPERHSPSSSTVTNRRPCSSTSA